MLVFINRNLVKKPTLKESSKKNNLSDQHKIKDSPINNHQCQNIHQPEQNPLNNLNFKIRLKISSERSEIRNTSLKVECFSLKDRKVREKNQK